MPVDPSLVGHTYPPTEPYEVSREKIREFAEAINDPNPVYRDRAAAEALGYPDVIAPPTFPIRLTLLATNDVVRSPEFGIDYSRVVHGDQRFSYTRPVRAGDVLQVVVSIEDNKLLAANDFVTSRCVVTTVDGEDVVTAVSTIVVRGES